MYKVIFSDMDGTLLDSKSQIPSSTLKAIETIKQKGTYFLPCTGRVPYALEKLIAGTGLQMDNYVSCNGALVVCNNNIVHKVTMDHKYVKMICDYVIKENLFVRFYTEDDMYTFEKLPVPDNYKGSIPITLSYEEAMKKIEESNIYKMTIVDNRPEVLKDMEQKLREHTNNEVHFTYTSATFLEIVSKGENKGKAVEIFCKSYGFETSEAIGIGDNENDILMLEKCGLSCCPSNATPEVKKICKYVSPYSNNEEAVKDIIEKFVLNS